MVVKPSGRLMLVSNLFPARLDSPRIRTVEGSVIDVRFVYESA